MMEVKLLVLYLTVLYVLVVGLTEVHKQQHFKCFRLVVWVGVWSAAAPHHHILPLLTEMLPLCTLTHWCMLLFLWLFLPLFDQQWSIGGGERAEARGSGSNPNSGRHISSPPAPREDALFSVTWSEDNYLFFYLEVEGDTFSSSMWKSFDCVTPDPASHSFIYHRCDSEAQHWCLDRWRHHTTDSLMCS